MPTCRTCFFCIPKYGRGPGLFQWGTCYQAQRKVLANMLACNIYQEREGKVTVKSNPKKRNKYMDKDGNSMAGMTLSEVLGKPLTILAKREYKWGLYEGLAVKVRGPNGKLGVVEITAEIPIKALNEPKLPKPPYKARFIEKTSANKRRYYTIEVLGDDDLAASEEDGREGVSQE